ncbi:LuxR C-terminal-related transcriptional regulator [Kribbella italica]|uniref:DNA-binding NarL/FixJ family response regulator n=1 Tax=Kribbella italica TaxID=1540520 RepID=A0A7W9JA14_9ACTN|nr:LuxR C-terminal-related transcriptional regulator [Kribbella italica]MBB5838089.1 DNA-binding NarL/FixJ family response regulator [Kribbella italica]
MGDGKVAPARFDAGTAIVLREAYHKIDAQFRGNHYGLYDYARAVAAKIARVDTFYVGLLHGSNRVRYPFGYEDGKYDDPATHTFGPQGPTAWLLRKRQTYRFAYDNGAALMGGIPCGDVTKVSADAVIVPMFRADGERMFGMMSIQSYQPGAYDDNAVRAFEWLTGTVARVLDREAEDREALRLLPAGEETPNLLTSDHVMEYLSNRIAVLRGLADEALGEPEARAEPLRGHLTALRTTAEKIQSELIEMMLDADEGPEQRFGSLTKAQQGIAVLLVQGLDNDALAAELGISLNTVKSHLGTILRKYAMDSRVQVADDVRKYLAR